MIHYVITRAAYYFAMAILLTRSKEGITGVDSVTKNEVFSMPGAFKVMKASKTCLILASSSTVYSYSLPSFTLSFKFDCAEISELSVSSCFRYVGVIDKKLNVRIMDLTLSKLVFTDTCSGSSGAAVMAPKWISHCVSTSSTSFVRVGRNEVLWCDIFSDDRIERHKIPLEGVKCIYTFADYCVAFSKGPQHNALHVLKDGKVLQKFTLGRADRIDVLPLNKIALITTHCDVDQSGQSYYGESFLYLLNCKTLTCKRVGLSGPFHDVAWLQDSFFFALHGFMPATASVVSATTLEQITTIPNIGSKNTIKCMFDCGLIAVAGLGNLPGSIDIFQMSKEADRTKFTKLAAFSAPGSSIMEWGNMSGQPVLLTAVTHPRLRVDNSFVLWTWNGTKIMSSDFKELYHAVMISDDQGLNGECKIDETTLKVAARLSASTKKVEPYRPPSLRSPAPTLSSLPKTTEITREERISRRLQERLDQITELKVRRARGDFLEASQIEKIEREAEIRKEIAALQSLIHKQ